MIHLAAFSLSVAAFAAFAAATERQQQALFYRTLSRATAGLMRTCGWSLLLAALAVLVRGQGWALGLVSYSGHTSAGAGVVFLALVFLGRQRTRV